MLTIQSFNLFGLTSTFLTPDILTINDWCIPIDPYHRYSFNAPLTATPRTLFCSRLSAAAEAKIGVVVIHDGFVRTGCLAPPSMCLLTFVVVKVAYDLPILCSLILFSIHGNLCVAVTERSCSTELSAGLLVSGISHHYHVSPESTSSCGGASSAGSSSRHVEGLPGQVVCRILVVSCIKEDMRQAAIVIE